MKWKKLFQKCNIFSSKRSSKTTAQEREGSPWNNIGYTPDSEQENFYILYARIGKKTTCRSCKESVRDWNRCSECGEAIPRPETTWQISFNLYERS